MSSLSDFMKNPAASLFSHFPFKTTIMGSKITGIAVMLCLVQGIVFSQATIHNPNLSDDRYRNPVIHADYSDPDVVRVGADYYMTASSFSHFPGLPILHSKDLVNWKIIGHAALTYPDTSFRLPQHGNAIWAPSIRHHNGTYYIYYGDPDRGVFMTKATNPAGPWSPLKLIKKVTGWIDCCPLWDEDGKAYLVHAYANSRVGLKSVLLVNEMNPNGEEILGTSTLVFNGQQNHNTIEGPKFYKRNGYYYIFAPAGGVATGWQTILRSKNIFGPYEEKIVLEQGSTQINGPHQGGWVSGTDGREWFIHFQDKGAYGRIIHLQPLRWVNDWPEMGQDYDGNGVGEPVTEFAKPYLQLKLWRSLKRPMNSTTNNWVYNGSGKPTSSPRLVDLEQWPAAFDGHGANGSSAAFGCNPICSCKNFQQKISVRPPN